MQVMEAGDPYGPGSSTCRSCAAARRRGLGEIEAPGARRSARGAGRAARRAPGPRLGAGGLPGMDGRRCRAAPRAGRRAGPGRRIHGSTAGPGGDATTHLPYRRAAVVVRWQLRRGILPPLTGSSSGEMARCRRGVHPRLAFPTCEDGHLPVDLANPASHLPLGATSSGTWPSSTSWADSSTLA